MSRALALGLLAVALSANAADDAGKDQSSLSKVLSNYAVDLGIPDTPGLAIAGLTSQNVLRPTTLRALWDAAVVQGRTDDGKAKAGFAVAVAPTKMILPAMTKAEYRDHPFVARPLWNAQVSLGVGQPLSDADKSTRIGVGLSTVLWRSEASDPLVNVEHGQCLQQALDHLRDAQGTNFGGPSTPEEIAAAKAKEAAAQKELDGCYKSFADKTWNSTALMVGVATLSISGRDPALLPDAHTHGYWASFNYGFDGIPNLQPHLQFTATYRRLTDEIVGDSLDKTKLVVQDSHLLGAKLYGRSSVANLFVEASRLRASIAGRATENTRIFVFGAEKKIASNMWLTLAMAKKHGGTDASPINISTGIRIGYETDASLTK